MDEKKMNNNEVKKMDKEKIEQAVALLLENWENIFLKRQFLVPILEIWIKETTVGAACCPA